MDWNYCRWTFYRICVSLPLPSRTVCRANLAVHSLWSETGPTSQMPRAYHCELMYSARRSARAIRLRGIRGEYLFATSNYVGSHEGDSMLSCPVAGAPWRLAYENTQARTGNRLSPQRMTP